MKPGAIFPHQEIGNDPAIIKDWVQTAEGLGYSHVVAYDHVLGGPLESRTPELIGPYTEKDAFHEPFVLFGFMAACTSRIGFATGVLILPQRQTALVAKQVAELDLLSGGRMRLGVGTGWNFIEYDSLNEDFKTRGPRQVEQVEVLERFWADPIVSYSGDYHEIDRAGLNPLPNRQIPIWFGGFTDVAFKRAARVGDGFMFGGAHEYNVRGIDRVRQFVSETGRSVDAFGVEAFIDFQDREHWQSCADDLAGLDVDYLSMRTITQDGQGLENPQSHIRALEAFANEVDFG